MKIDIILCGVGGQGVLSLAAIIAQAAGLEGLQVRQSEVHGMAQRGGAVQAHLRISSQSIASDLVPMGQADMILSMESLEGLRYLEYLRPGGVLVSAAESFINIPNYPDPESLAKALSQVEPRAVVPAANLAKEAGNPKAVNMVLVGAAAAWLPLRPESLDKAITKAFIAKGQSVVDQNLRALASGRRAAESQTSGRRA